MNRRESLLESLQVGKPDSSYEEQFRKRVEHWKELALGFLPEIYTLRRAINSISQRYFDGQQSLFPDVEEGLNDLVVTIEQLVEIFDDGDLDDFDPADQLGLQNMVPVPSEP